LTGVTAELNIRFLHPVDPEQEVVIHASIEKQKSRLYVLKGVLRQNGEIKNTAQAKFWHIPDEKVHSE
jgi:acyl-coenzyme A thioesterase PaaI-like protein